MIIDMINAPDHSWGRVQIIDVIAAGIADKISSYSYALGLWAYLEEDRDLPIYVNALRVAGETVEFNPIYVDGFDRNKWRWLDEPVQKFIKDNSK